MKPLRLFIFFSCLWITDATAQKLKTFKIKPGEKVVEKIPAEEMYSYPQFTAGTVYLKNNTYAPARLNYNSLFGEMQFIGPNADTISLSDEKNIKEIVINTDTFYYNEGYLKLVLNRGGMKLANKRFIRFINREKLNGFGESTGGSIDTYSTMSSSYLKELVASEILTLRVDNILYIGDKFNNFIVANKRNLLELFSSNATNVEKYLKEKKVNFSSEEDLKALIMNFK